MFSHSNDRNIFIIFSTHLILSLFLLLSSTLNASTSSLLSKKGFPKVIMTDSCLTSLAQMGPGQGEEEGKWIWGYDIQDKLNNFRPEDGQVVLVKEGKSIEIDGADALSLGPITPENLPKGKGARGKIRYDGTLIASHDVFGERLCEHCDTRVPFKTSNIKEGKCTNCGAGHGADIDVLWNTFRGKSVFHIDSIARTLEDVAAQNAGLRRLCPSCSQFFSDSVPESCPSCSAPKHDAPKLKLKDVNTPRKPQLFGLPDEPPPKIRERVSANPHEAFSLKSWLFKHEKTLRRIGVGASAALLYAIWKVPTPATVLDTYWENAWDIQKWQSGKAEAWCHELSEKEPIMPGNGRKEFGGIQNIREIDTRTYDYVRVVDHYKEQEVWVPDPVEFDYEPSGGGFSPGGDGGFSPGGGGGGFSPGGNGGGSFNLLRRHSNDLESLLEELNIPPILENLDKLKTILKRIEDSDKIYEHMKEFSPLFQKENLISLSGNTLLASSPLMAPLLASGHYETRQVPVYRLEPVMRAWCEFDTYQWSTIDKVFKGGSILPDGTTEFPWPKKPELDDPLLQVLKRSDRKVRYKYQDKNDETQIYEHSFDNDKEFLEWSVGDKAEILRRRYSNEFHWVRKSK